MNTRTTLIATDIFIALSITFVLHAAIVGADSVYDGIMYGLTFRYLLKLFPFCLLAVFSSYMTGVYNLEKYPKLKEHVFRILIAGLLFLLAAYALYYPLNYVPGTTVIEKAIIAGLFALFVLLQVIWHTAYFSFINARVRRVLILGTGSLAKKIGESLSSENCNCKLTGYINMNDTPMLVPGELVVGSGSQLSEIARKERVDEIVVSLGQQRGILPSRDVLTCKFSGIKVFDAPSFYEKITGKLLIENIQPSWFIFNDRFKITYSRKFMKRSLDLLCGAAGLILSFPLLPFIALLIKADSRGPVLFRQMRVGAMEKGFMIYKFRTMVLDAESSTGAVWAKEKDPRITRVGSLLRKTRLDELPQLFNILKGDMSIIGPRPERPEFIENLSKIIPFYSERHFVKPGLTGWAQIRYQYGASVEDAIEKLRYDLYYIKNWSIFLDLMILLETVRVVLFGRGAR